jgi:hypothetical protein
MTCPQLRALLFFVRRKQRKRSKKKMLMVDADRRSQKNKTLLQMTDVNSCSYSFFFATLISKQNRLSFQGNNRRFKSVQPLPENA